MLCHLVSLLELPNCLPVKTTSLSGNSKLKLKLQLVCTERHVPEKWNDCQSATALKCIGMTMERLPLVMPQFQPILADANQISYRNTVAVHNADNSWWLGYLQDMDGDQAFIHFDAKNVTDRWVHMGCVWPLQFYWDDNRLTSSHSIGMRIYAALRDEDDGPFQFRPVTVVDRLRGCEKMSEVLYVQTHATAVNGKRGSVRLALVQNCQISKQLPPADSPLLHQSRRGPLCSKFLVAFPGAQALLNDASDKFRIIMHFRKLFLIPPFCRSLYCCDVHAAGQFKIGKLLGEAADRQGEGGLYYSEWSDCRFHLRIERDGCTFVIMSPAMGAEMAQHMRGTLTEVLETHLASRAHFPSIRSRNLDHHGLHSLHDKDAEIDPVCTGMNLCHLPPYLQSEIFPHMDLHSQMRAKRVCALWQLLLSSPRLTEHISIALDSCARYHSDNSSNCFRAASLLNRTINTTTATLTVLGEFLPHNFLFLSEVLRAMKITLRLIVFKDHIIAGRGGKCDQYSLSAHPATSVITSYKNIGDFILLRNCQVDHLFSETMWYVFEWFRLPLPAHERSFKRNLLKDYQERRELPIDQLRITIPQLLLRCDESEMLMASRVMCALNDNFPPVKEDMLQKVTAVHARWVRTLCYPDDWQAIRNYLIL
ncbi:uncharacterized protein LOC129595439 isoform X2 [Paramacrobiotus metropolitanus]|nr:uncharacterized protein LOC129595439 isoform X2 [Paramacrobiotus metropolitanus]